MKRWLSRIHIPAVPSTSRRWVRSPNEYIQTPKGDFPGGDVYRRRDPSADQLVRTRLMTLESGFCGKASGDLEKSLTSYTNRRPSRSDVTTRDPSCEET